MGDKKCINYDRQRLPVNILLDFSQRRFLLHFPSHELNNKTLELIGGGVN